jgi:PPOX class probable F420-dependent enzyme
MAGGRCRQLVELPHSARAVVDEARRAVLATIGPSGQPHAVPVCFAVRGSDVVTAIDDKPKRARRLARVANIERNAVATLLVDRWDERWERLAWVMLQGRAALEPPGSSDEQLVARYPQYQGSPPTGPVIRVRPELIIWWSWT